MVQMTACKLENQGYYTDDVSEKIELSSSLAEHHPRHIKIAKSKTKLNAKRLPEAKASSGRARKVQPLQPFESQ